METKKTFKQQRKKNRIYKHAVETKGQNFNFNMVEVLATKTWGKPSKNDGGSAYKAKQEVYK